MRKTNKTQEVTEEAATSEGTTAITDDISIADDISEDTPSPLKLRYYLDEGAYAPEKAHDNDAGFDLRLPKTSSPITMTGVSDAVIDTGVHVEIPNGYCGLLVSKSGLNVKHNITSTGLIDAGYVGSIVVKLYRTNFNGTTYTFNPGDKITQLVILPIPNVALTEVDSMDAFDIDVSTERGTNGFGSSGR